MSLRVTIIMSILFLLILGACSDEGVNNSTTEEEKSKDKDAIIEELEAEVERLTRDLENLIGEKEDLYNEAINYMKNNEWSKAEDTFNELIILNPTDSLTEKSEGQLKEIKDLKKQENNAIDPPPLEIVSKHVENDGFIYNDGYVSLKNVTDQSVDRFQMAILTFDKEGYPVNADYSDDNIHLSVGDSNIHPEDTLDEVYWNVSGQAEKIKVVLKQVEFFEHDPWVNELYQDQLEKEKSRY